MYQKLSEEKKKRNKMRIWLQIIQKFFRKWKRKRS